VAPQANFWNIQVWKCKFQKTQKHPPIEDFDNAVSEQQIALE
jgi:hypothetical protein